MFWTVFFGSLLAYFVGVCLGLMALPFILKKVLPVVMNKIKGGFFNE